MRYKIFKIQILLILFVGFSGSAQNSSEIQSFKEFYKPGKMKVKKGYYNIYSDNERYFIEIPEKTLGQDLFIAAQITKGYSSSISNQSGIYQFKKGRNNYLDLYKNKSTTFSKDSLDYSMVQSIKKSGLEPSYKNYPIVATGKTQTSFIIELTQELTATSGVFSLSDPGPIASPDPTRSDLLSYEAHDNGVVFKAYATQSSFGPSQSGSDENYISAYEFEMVMQAIPKHNYKQKANHPAYGFNTIEHIEYDTKEFRAHSVEYVKKWNLDVTSNEGQNNKILNPKNAIKVWIDPTTPVPFVESVKKALNQWETAFEVAGLKDVFQIVEDATQAYKKINFFWGNAYADISYETIENPVTGEIVSARVNFMDESAKTSLPNYLLICGEHDSEIMKDIDNLEYIKQMLATKLASTIGEILGVKANYPAVTAFSIAQLQDIEWLKKWGPSATVIGATMPNYIANKNKEIKLEYLLPKVSIYDRDAIAYLYGNRVSSPSLISCYYTAENILDPTAQSSFISNDLLEAGEIGIQKLKYIYPKIPAIINNSYNNTNISAKMNQLISKCFSMYQYFVNQEAVLIGGQLKRTVIKGENEVPVLYISKKKQLEVLKSLEKSVFSENIEWLNNPELIKMSPRNLDQFYVDMSNNILKRMFKKEVIASLIEAEKKHGKKAFRCDDLFSFINRVVFLNFDASKEPTQVQMSTQVNVVNILIELANTNNITGGVNDLSAIIHLYLIEVRDAIENLLDKDKTSAEVKNNCRLMLLRLNRGYFNKAIK